MSNHGAMARPAPASGERVVYMGALRAPVGCHRGVREIARFLFCSFFLVYMTRHEMLALLNISTRGACKDSRKPQRPTHAEPHTASRVTHGTPHTCVSVS